MPDLATSKLHPTVCDCLRHSHWPKGFASSGPNSRGVSVVTWSVRALFTISFQKQPGVYWTMWSVRPCSPTAGTTFPSTQFSVLPGWCGGQLKWFLTTPAILTMGPSNSIPGHAPRRTENRDLDICMPIFFFNIFY